MSAEPFDLHRLAEVVKARRDELDLSHDDIARLKGPSDTTMSKIENETTAPRRDTRRKLDAVLRWAPGSTLAVMKGGDPLPVDTAPAGPRGMAAELEAANLSPATLAYIKQVLAEDEQRRADERRESS